MSVYYPAYTTSGFYPITSAVTAATNITAISFPQIEQQVGSPPEESDLDWLRRRISEVTELAA